jgi:putative ABC transport system permease protein
MRLWEDVRYGLRIFQRTPGFTAVAVFTLALGIGANTAIFSIIQAVLLRPLPYNDSGRLVAIWDREVQAKGISKLFDAYHDFETYRSKSHSLEQVAAATWAIGGRIMTGHGSARTVLAIPVSYEFFTLLGVQPVAGRTFRSEDLQSGCTLVLAHRFWQNVLSRDDKIVGETLRVDDQACTVVGVMPASFTFYPEAASMWSLITPQTADTRHLITGIFARLKPGASLKAAQDELRSLHRREAADARHSIEMEPEVFPLQEEFNWLASRNLKLTILVLFGAVAFVLLIACVNVANLLLGRSLTRQKEFAIRAALGSERGRLLQQLLTEALLLAFTAAALGGLLAVGAIHWFRSNNPIELPPGNRAEVNVWVLAFTAALSILTTVIFGFFPAWRASRVQLLDVLKAQGRAGTHGAGRRAVAKGLLVAEVALSLVLLVGAGLLMRSVARFEAAPFTSQAERLITMTLSLPAKAYATNDQKIRFYTQLIDGLRALPALRQPVLATRIPVWGGDGLSVLEVEGRPAPSPGRAPHDTGVLAISPEYFAVVGPALEEGRPFDSRDSERSQPVAIVNQSLVKEYFAGENPLGQHIRLLDESGANPWLTIVGVVANQKSVTVYREMAWVERPTLYRPFRQQPAAGMNLMAASNLSAARVGDIVQRQTARLDPSVAVDEVQTMEHLLDRHILAYPHFRAQLLGAFAALALLLAAVGLYGVLAQLVAQRTQEIGVRMALGARTTDVLAATMKEGMLLVGAGVALGLGGAWLLTRFLAALLYGVQAMDPLILAGVSGILILASLLAIYIPARRAAGVDPMVALRYE